MKKTIIFATILIVSGVLFFNGCTKRSNKLANTFEPEGKLVETSTVENPRVIIKLQENERLLFLEILLEAIKDNQIQFNSKNASVVLRKKIEAIVLMYNEKNLKGAIRKIEKDILPKMENVIEPDQQAQSVISIIKQQLYFFKNPEKPIYLTQNLWQSIVKFFQGLLKLSIGVTVIHLEIDHVGEGGMDIKYSSGSEWVHIPECTDGFNATVVDVK